MLQHNECIHLSLELQGEILQINNPPEFSQQIFSYAEQTDQLWQTDRYFQILKPRFIPEWCRQWIRTKQNNKIIDRFRTINYVRKIVLHSYLLSVLYFNCHSMYTCLLFSDIVFKWTIPYVWVPRVCNDVLVKIIIVILKWILLISIQIP